jgi:5-methylcytosine-specific restriction endonuclease McrA
MSCKQPERAAKKASSFDEWIKKKKPKAKPEKKLTGKNKLDQAKLKNQAVKKLEKLQANRTIKRASTPKRKAKPKPVGKAKARNQPELNRLHQLFKAEGCQGCRVFFGKHHEATHAEHLMEQGKYPEHRLNPGNLAGTCPVFNKEKSRTNRNGGRIFGFFAELNDGILTPYTIKYQQWYYIPGFACTTRILRVEFNDRGKPIAIKPGLWVSAPIPDEYNNNLVEVSGLRHVVPV